MNFRHDNDAPGAAVVATSDENDQPEILIVDDSPKIREFYALLLRLSGYRVLQAHNGIAAQSILKSRQPTLVISDLEMPVSDGWEVLAYCHNHHPKLPVLIVSGAELGRHPAIERWAAGFLPKPFNLVKFHDQVERLTRRTA